MDVHGHAEPAALRGDEPEDEILECLVVTVAGVRTFGIGARRITDLEGAQIRELELLGERPALLVPLERSLHHLVEVLAKRGWARLHAALVVVALEELVLEREERFLVRRVND